MSIVTITYAISDFFKWVHGQLVTVKEVSVSRMMCGSITCSHCGHKQSAEAWHHDRNKLPLQDYAYRCNACGNPFPEPTSGVT